MLSGLFAYSQRVTRIIRVLAPQKSEILLHDWKWMEFTGSRMKVSAIYPPKILENPVFEEGISKSHANALGMPLLSLLIF